MDLEVDVRSCAAGITGAAVESDRLPLGDALPAGDVVAGKVGVVVRDPVVGHQVDGVSAECTGPGDDCSGGDRVDRLVVGRHEIDAFVSSTA